MTSLQPSTTLARIAAHWLICSAVVGYYVGEVRTVEAPHKYVYKG
jgi:hypothetical protein